MSTNEVFIDSYTYSLFHKINEQLKNWSGQALIGKGFFATHGSVAYLELKMYATHSKRNDCELIWNIAEHPLAIEHPTYKADIEQVLHFFVKYIAALTGEPYSLCFELNDAAFDFSEKRAHPFEKAAVYALIGCFDRELPNGSEERVNMMKEKTASLLQSGFWDKED